jgi:hypothetical protein
VTKAERLRREGIRAVVGFPQRSWDKITRRRHGTYTLHFATLKVVYIPSLNWTEIDERALPIHSVFGYWFEPDLIAFQLLGLLIRRC